MKDSQVSRTVILARWSAMAGGLGKLAGVASDRMQAGTGATLAQCLLRQGRHREADVLLRDALHLIEAKKLFDRWAVVSVNALAEFWLGSVERGVGVTRRQAFRRARKFCLLATKRSRVAVGWLAETHPGAQTHFVRFALNDPPFCRRQIAAKVVLEPIFEADFEDTAFADRSVAGLAAL